MANTTRQFFKPRDKAGVERQRMLADAMQAAGMQGAPQSWDRMRVVPEYGAGHALTQLAQAMSGAYLNKKANEADKDLDAERRKKLAEAMGIPSMTQGYEAPSDGVGPVRDPNKLPEARANQQALQRFNETVPLDVQEQIMQQQAITKAFPAPPKQYELAEGARVVEAGGRVIAENPRAVKPDDDDVVSRYRIAVEQGYKGSLLEYQKELARSGATNVNVDTKEEFPKPPPGTYRPDKTQPGLRFEPGSPQEIEYKQARTKATAGFSAALDGMQRTWKTVDELLNMDTSGITGNLQGTEIGGAITRSMSQKAATAHAKLQSLLAQMGFKELADMRAASPTGGALGSITERELQLLQNAAATLMTTQDDATFRQALQTIQQQLEKSAMSLQQAYKTDFDEAYQQPPVRPVIDQQNPQQPPAPVPPTGRAPPSNQAPSLELAARVNTYYDN